jgi:hypothetical protein
MITLEAPLALLIALPLAYLWWQLGRGPRAVRVLRALILVLCAFALASPVMRTRDAGRSLVFLVDRSLSAGDEAVKTSAEMLELVLEKKAPTDRVHLVLFGESPALLLGGGNLPAELKAAKLEDASDLHAGLHLAGALAAGGSPGRIFVVSDGLYTGPDPLELSPELRKKGVSVHVLPVGEQQENDVAVTRVMLPERARVGDPFEVAFAVHAPGSCGATIRLASASSRFEQEVALRAGENRFAFRHALGRPGLATYQVAVLVEGDNQPENNRAAAVTEGVGPSEVLLVNQAGKAGNLAGALAASGLAVRVHGPGRPVTSARLKAFRAVVLENVALSSLNDRADRALQRYVGELGGGVLVTGGQNSFAAGGYYHSRLDPLLPVSMERKEEYKRPRVAMAIVLDRSGSMSMTVPTGETKMDLANRAAAEAVALLDAQDEVAVFAVDSRPHRVVKLTRLGGQRGDVRKRILSIDSMGGGIFVYEGLKAAVSELRKGAAPTRHVVLFSDAADSEEPGGYKALVDAWAKAGGTISVIGLGTDKDVDAHLLKDIAARGGGTCMFTADPKALPRIFCQDAIRIARKTFIEEKTDAVVTGDIAQIGKLDIRSFPTFLGYNLCYRKDDAAQIVVTTDEHQAPVLAVWQRGLGKVAALTCEADGPYTGNLRGWDGYQPLLASVVKWLQKGRDDPALFGTIARAGRTASVLLELDETAARECTGARAVIIPPDESDPIELPLQWTSPQTLEAPFRLAQNGVYHGVIVTREGKRVSLPPVVLPYSPEFERRPADAGLDMLNQLAERTGGGRVMHVEDLLAEGGLTGSRRAETHLAPWLAAVVLALLLSDLVARRALWGHLLPAFIARGARKTRTAVAELPGRVRKRLARRREPKTGAAEPAAPEPEAARPEPPSTAEPTTGESVFDRAKRRSRK